MNMRLFKGFFFVLAGLFIFITILSLFIPSKLVVTRAVVIHAKADKVFAEISNLHNWKHWQPVFIVDSANIKFDTDANGISNSCEWNSKGKKNKILITDKKDHVLTASLFRQGENIVLNTIRVLPLADSNQVQAEWTVLIKFKWYPWEKLYGIFIENITGGGYEDALNSLKGYVEHN
jgi:Polyketide cyclase / dehydrase and lipid transport